MIKDYAAIFQKVKEENNITYYMPIDVTEGIYLEKNNTFTAHNITLKHIVAGEDYGYCNREALTALVNKHKYMPMFIAKRIILNELRKGTYVRAVNEKNIPIILFQEKEEWNILMEGDIANYYIRYFPEVITYENSEKEVPQNIEIDINKIYSEIKKKIPNQDNHIKEILSIIWRDFNNYQNIKSRSILINGEKSSPKKEIFNIIEDNINIPVLNTSAINKYKNNVTLNTVNDILTSLLKKCNYDIKKAETSIIVMDDIDTITILDQNDARLFGEYQTDLIRLINGLPFTIEIDGDSYTIDTSKMLVVLMGDFMKYEEEMPLVKGFANTPNGEKKNMTRIDYINEGLLEDLVISIQNIIELDKPTTKEYIANISKDEDNSLNISKKFLESLNIRLTVEETAIKRISEVIEKNGYAEGQINEIIDKALALAAFEIATNPNTYEELIISEDTISNNSKYKLIKRKK